MILAVFLIVTVGFLGWLLIGVLYHLKFVDEKPTQFDLILRSVVVDPESIIKMYRFILGNVVRGPGAYQNLSNMYMEISKERQ